MKKELLIKKLENADYLPEIVKMHQEIFDNTSLQDNLIYFDSGFNDYFRGVFNLPDHFVYGIFLEETIQGFLHLKMNSDTLFLNNIYLDKKIRGNGNGTFSLASILRSLSNKSQNIVSLELDVLASNHNAKKWYDKIGMEQQHTSHWYFVEKENRKNNVNFEIIKDSSHFKGIYLDHIKVGTLIEKRTVIIHKLEALDYDRDLVYIFKLDEEEELPDNLRFTKFDSSIRMKGNILNILKNIKDVQIRKDRA